MTPFAPTADIEAFIEHGIARTRSEEHVIDEPLAVMALSNWLNKSGHFSLLDCLQEDVGKHAPRENAFEGYLAFFLRKAFEETPRLDSVFTFRSDFGGAIRKSLDLSWQNEAFELVTVSIPAGMDQQKVSTVGPSCGPITNVGLLAKTDDDVLNWISENKECYAFCFPPASAGPDFFFYVRSKATGRLLLVAFQAKNYMDVDKPTLVHGVRTITPPFFWKSKDEKVHVA